MYCSILLKKFVMMTNSIIMSSDVTYPMLECIQLQSWYHWMIHSIYRIYNTVPLELIWSTTTYKAYKHRVMWSYLHVILACGWPARAPTQLDLKYKKKSTAEKLSARPSLASGQIVLPLLRQHRSWNVNDTEISVDRWLLAIRDTKASY